MTRSAPLSLVWDNLRLTLVARRRLAGMSQHELSMRIGQSRSQVTEWENGTHTPSVTCLLRWLSALDMTMRFMEWRRLPSRRQAG